MGAGALEPPPLQLRQLGGPGSLAARAQHKLREHTRLSLFFGAPSPASDLIDLIPTNTQPPLQNTLCDFSLITDTCW